MEKQSERERKVEEYKEYVERITPTHNCVINMFHAFISGGLICLLGQVLWNVLENQGFEHVQAVNYTLLIMISISVVLTGFNLATPIVKFAGAGFLVPITGFANAVTACAIEYKKEGQVFGVGSKIFTISGPVILYGIVTSSLLGLIYFLYLLV